MKFVCPECGGRLQATRTEKTFLDIRDDGRVSVSGGCMDEVRVYCENDHEIPESRLSDAVAREVMRA